jgi:16S rRNA (cytosine1402-N4)-methyltransferase
MTYHHQPVLLEEVVDYLAVKPNNHFIDATLGGGGHARAILEKSSPRGELFGFDRDPAAVMAATENLKEFKNRIHLFNESYKNINKNYESKINLDISGVLLDLGLSSFQLSPQDERGFSFQTDRPLDMRFGPEDSLTAADILNTFAEQKLVDIFKKYGEELQARAIAKKVIFFRARKPFKLTSELVSVVGEVYGGRLKRPSRIHPATKVFQALRIAVNDELTALEQSLPGLLEVIKSGGRLAIISYHSLEDRIVKDFFKLESRDCLCPKELPECRCGHLRRLKILTKKPITPSAKEISGNPRSRSAKLRVIEKI